MPIAPGQKITAADWNELTERLNKIFADKFPGSAPTESLPRRNLQSYGWGQSNTNTVVKGEKFTAAIANTVIDKVRLGAQQVGSTYTLANVSKGQKISALSIGHIKTVLDDIEPKRNVAGPGQLAFAFLGNTIMSTGWTNAIEYIGTLNFGNYDRARHYFNSGSSIKLTLSLSNGNSSSNILNGLYERMGTVNISLYNTVSSTPNTISEGKGFEDLNSAEWIKLIEVQVGGGGGYGYGYGYGNGYGYGYGCNGYGYGYGGGYGYGYGSGSYGYGYGGYGYGYGNCTGSVVIYGKIDGGKVLLKTVVTSQHSGSKTGLHKLNYNTQKAIDKSSNGVQFHIEPPAFSGTVVAAVN